MQEKAQEEGKRAAFFTPMKGKESEGKLQRKRRTCFSNFSAPILKADEKL